MDPAEAARRACEAPGGRWPLSEGAEEPDARFRRLLEAVLDGPGVLDAEVRRRAAATALPGPAGAFVAKLAGAGTVDPRDVEALRRAGYTHDEVFELTISAALGAAKRRLDAGLRALGEAEMEDRP